MAGSEKHPPGHSRARSPRAAQSPRLAEEQNGPAGWENLSTRFRRMAEGTGDDLAVMRLRHRVRAALEAECPTPVSASKQVGNAKAEITWIKYLSGSDWGRSLALACTVALTILVAVGVLTTGNLDPGAHGSQVAEAAHVDVDVSLAEGGFVQIRFADDAEAHLVQTTSIMRSRENGSFVEVARAAEFTKGSQYRDRVALDRPGTMVFYKIDRMD